MLRTALLIVLILLLNPALVAAGQSTPVASPVPHPSCADLDKYMDDVLYGTFSDLPDADQDLVREFIADDADPTTVRPSKLRRISEALDRWAGKLEDVDPDEIPHAAQDFHELITENISVLSSVANAVAASGPLSLWGFAEEAESLPIRWEEVHQNGRAMCGDAWDRFDDGLGPPPEDPN